MPKSIRDLIVELKGQPVECVIAGGVCSISGPKVVARTLKEYAYVPFKWDTIMEVEDEYFTVKMESLEFGPRVRSIRISSVYMIEHYGKGEGPGGF